MLQIILALTIGIVTLVGVLFRPWHINEGVAALIGGALVITVGLVSVPQVGVVLSQNANVFGFFLGMMALSVLAEGAGFFEWSAAHAARLANGNVRRLLVGVMLLGVITSTLLSNDATALILTPIVYTLVKRLELNPIPFTFACVFIADAASFVLPVSNPINIIVLSAFQLPLGTFFRLLLLPSIVVIALNIGLFLVLFRKSIRGTFDNMALEQPNSYIRHPAYFRLTLITLAVVAVAYLTFSILQLPLSIVALLGASALAVGALRYGLGPWTTLARGISWPIFGFIAGMALVVRAVENVGVVRLFGDALLRVGGAQHDGNHPTLALVGVTVFGSAIGANLINNIPMAVVMTAVLHQVNTVTQPVRLALIGATIFGCDLGANLTTVGSLAKIFWLLLLRQRGLKVTAFDYIKVGVVVTPPMLLAGGLVLWWMVH